MSLPNPSPAEPVPVPAGRPPVPQGPWWSLIDRNNLTVVIHFTALLGLAGHLLFIPLFMWLGVVQMAAINVGSCVIFAICYWLNRRGHPHLTLLLGVAEVVGHAALAVAFVGWDSGFHYYILGLTPLIFYSPQWRTPFKLTLVGLLTWIYVTLYFYALVVSPLAQVDVSHLRLVGVVNIVTLFAVFSAVAYYYRLAATSAERALQMANRRLEVQAHTDPLTRLANRRNMQDRIDQAMAAHRLQGLPFSIVLGDIDNFKVFNDTYGHEAGDVILVRLADLMRQHLRDQDQVARWGGEEFLLLVTGARLDEARMVAERLREKIAVTPQPVGELWLKITMTFGVAEFAGEPDSGHCIGRADRALYEGKRLGRNQVVGQAR